VHIEASQILKHGSPNFCFGIHVDGDLNRNSEAVWDVRDVVGNIII
jgi:hypothetical protein